MELDLWSVVNYLDLSATNAQNTKGQMRIFTISWYESDYNHISHLPPFTNMSEVVDLKKPHYGSYTSDLMLQSNENGA